MRSFANPSDQQKFLLIRLALRKPEKWYRLDNLKYERDLGSEIKSTLLSLCRSKEPAQPPRSTTPLSNNKSTSKPASVADIIDLTLSDEEDNHVKAEPQEVPLLPPQQGNTSLVKHEDVEPIVDTQVAPSFLDDVQPSQPTPEEAASEANVDLTWFAEDDTFATLTELLECLRVPELEKLAKERKLTCRKKVCIYLLDLTSFPCPAL